MEAMPLVMEPESRLYAGPVLVLDFQSLYPSQIIAYNLCFRWRPLSCYCLRHLSAVTSRRPPCCGNGVPAQLQWHGRSAAQATPLKAA